jgi:hypothetical protein
VTLALCRAAAIVLFAVFLMYGLTGTVRAPEVVPIRFDFGGRPSAFASRWVLFGMTALCEAALTVTVLIGPFSARPPSAIRAGAITLVAALCFCAYNHASLLEVARNPERRTRRWPFWSAFAVLGGIAIAANIAAPYLP